MLNIGYVSVIWETLGKENFAGILEDRQICIVWYSIITGNLILSSMTTSTNTCFAWHGFLETQVNLLLCNITAEDWNDKPEWINHHCSIDIIVNCQNNFFLTYQIDFDFKWPMTYLRQFTTYKQESMPIVYINISSDSSLKCCIRK